MKKLPVTLLVVMVSMTSCAINQRRGIVGPPKTLDDDWSRWLVGEWEGSFESSVGKGENWMEVELCLNGEFLITKYRSRAPKITYEHVQHLKETMGVSDNDIKNMRGSIYKGLEIRTIDPDTGEVFGQWFDNWRPVFSGRSRREGNKEIMEWEWPKQRVSIIRIIEKVSDDKFVMTGKWTMPNGSVMDDKTEMTRKKIMTKK
jgi:hypothetical protein